MSYQIKGNLVDKGTIEKAMDTGSGIIKDYGVEGMQFITNILLVVVILVVLFVVYKAGLLKKPNGNSNGNGNGQKSILIEHHMKQMAESIKQLAESSIRQSITQESIAKTMDKAVENQAIVLSKMELTEQKNKSNHEAIVTSQAHIEKKVKTGNDMASTLANKVVMMEKDYTQDHKDHLELLGNVEEVTSKIVKDLTKVIKTQVKQKRKVI